MIESKRLAQKAGTTSVWYKEHLVDSAAQLCSGTAVYALVEVFLLGMPVAVSLQARLITIAIALTGIGSIIARLRDVSLRLTGTADVRSEPRFLAHDLTFTVAVNLVLAPLIYGIAGANLRQMIYGTVNACLISILSGPANGYLLDRFRSWSGRNSNGRFAPLDPPAFGRIIVSISSAVALTACIYTWA